MFESVSKSKSQTQSDNQSKDKSHTTNNTKSVPIQTKSLFSPLAAQLKPISENNELIPIPEQTREQERLAPKVNNTGIPTYMKNRFEALSGFSFDDVKVHYNSDKPAQLQALAYTQGNQVYVAPGQEKHLGHELGHVVQQKRNRVSELTRVNGVPVNDSADLEREADSEVFDVGFGNNVKDVVQRRLLSSGTLTNNLVASSIFIDGEVQRKTDEIAALDPNDLFYFAESGEKQNEIASLIAQKKKLGYVGNRAKSAHHIIPSDIVERLIQDVYHVDIETIKTRFDDSWNGIMLPDYNAQQPETTVDGYPAHANHPNYSNYIYNSILNTPQKRELMLQDLNFAKATAFAIRDEILYAGRTRVDQPLDAVFSLPQMNDRQKSVEAHSNGFVHNPLADVDETSQAVRFYNENLSQEARLKRKYTEEYNRLVPPPPPIPMQPQ